MSIALTFNGQNYIIPTTNEVGWGSNLDDYLVAIAAGALQKTGGNFTLAAEVNFGGAFGLKSIYYKTGAANPALSGVLRLANGDLIEWRNGTNTGDVGLTVNSSNQLVFNGIPVQQTSLTNAHILVGNASNIATDVPMTGDIGIDNTGLTAIQSGVIVNNDVSNTAAIDYAKLALSNSIVNGDIATTAAIAYSKLAILAANRVVITDGSGIISTASALTINRVLLSDGSGIPTASSITNTTLGYLDATSSIQTQLNSKAADSAVVHLAGTETITGSKTFSSSILASNGTSGSPGYSFSAVTNAGFYIDGSGVVCLQNGLNRVLAPASATNQIIFGSPNLVTLNVVQPTANRIITLPDVGADANIVLDQGNQTISGIKTFSTAGTAIVGVTDGSDATAGYIGQSIESVVNNVSLPSTAQYGDLTSISLTAGDWDVSTSCYFARNGATYSAQELELGISVTAGNSGIGLIAGSNRLINQAISTTFTSMSLSIPVYRISLASTTTVYMKVWPGSYSAGTPQGSGRLSARRVR